MAPINTENILKLFQHGSSDVDWCEHNYVVLSSVAEFWNTLTSLIYFILPLTLASWHLKILTTDSDRLIMKASVLSVGLIGVGSVYFHGTLSYVGQLLDEISIVWICFLFYAMLMPDKYLEKLYRDKSKESKRKFKKMLAVACILTTVACFMKPDLNNFVLFVFLPPKMWIIIEEMKHCKCWKHKRCGQMFIVLFSASFACWVSDRTMCPIWRFLGFPYLHGFWHLLNAFGAYGNHMFFTYLKSKEDVMRREPLAIEFWPRNFPKYLSLPYLYQVKPLKQMNNNGVINNNKMA